MDTPTPTTPSPHPLLDLLNEVAWFLLKFIPAMVATTLLEAFVVRSLWGWFVVPALGAPPLSLPLAAGLCLTVQTIRPAWPPRESDDEFAAWWAVVKRQFLAPVVAWGIGWVIHVWATRGGA